MAKITVNGKDYIDAPALAKKLRLDVHNVRKFAREKRYPAFKLGRSWWFNVEEVEKAIFAESGYKPQRRA